MCVCFRLGCRPEAGCNESAAANDLPGKALAGLAWLLV